MSDTQAASARILVVEDDKTVAEVVTRYLTREGFEVEHVGDGAVALARVQDLMPDLMVLDLMLPGVDGREVCRRVRAVSDIPVIMLTALGETGDRIAGLELGADDYLAKPFSPRELVARVKNILKRSSGGQAEATSEVLEVDGISLNRKSRAVTIHGQSVDLTQREFDLLGFLMEHPKEVFRREVLLEHVWGYTFGDTSTVTVHVRRLREKIEPDPSNPTFVQTVWGVGYKFGV
ncbi:response regulator transcription factor [Euzebya tangerina]|uniref:response regulator transcription factor n=1 Tax=Euzebya tangerina TaxID=591198 RepID=UPI000E31B699|nr:response regulator transcription factor [Euzebya tangerina]